MEVKPALCPAHRSLLPDGKQLILYSSTALSQSLPCLFLERGLYTPPPSLPLARRPPWGSGSSQTENYVEDWLRRISNNSCFSLSTKKRRNSG